MSRESWRWQNTITAGKWPRHKNLCLIKGTKKGEYRHTFKAHFHA